MTQGNIPRYRVLAASMALGLALTGAHAQIPGDSPGGAPQYRDSTGVLKPGSGAAGTTNTTSGTWTPRLPASSVSAGSAPSADTGASSPAPKAASAPRSSLSKDRAPQRPNPR